MMRGVYVMVDANTPQAIPAGVTQLMLSPGILGMTLNQPWDRVETEFAVYDYSTALAALSKTTSVNRLLGWRVRGGEHTPAFRTGRTFIPKGTASWDIARGMTLPCPFTTGGNVNRKYMTGFRDLMRNIGTWSATHGVSILHTTRWGGPSAENYYVPEMTTLQGHSTAVVHSAHVQQVHAVQSLVPLGPAVEYPIGGMGSSTLPPLQLAEVAALNDSPRKQYLQLNWLDDRAGDTDTLAKWRFGTVPHGLQLIHPRRPDGKQFYWPRVFERATLNGAEYVEIFWSSFFTSPGVLDQSLMTEIAKWAAAA